MEIFQQKQSWQQLQWTRCQRRFCWWLWGWNILTKSFFGIIHLVCYYTKFFIKAEVLNFCPMICICTCGYQGLRNVAWKESFGYITNRWHLKIKTGHTAFKIIELCENNVFLTFLKLSLNYCGMLEKFAFLLIFITVELILSHSGLIKVAKKKVCSKLPSFITLRCHGHFVFWPESNLLSLVTLGDAIIVFLSMLLWNVLTDLKSYTRRCTHAPIVVQSRKRGGYNACQRWRKHTINLYIWSFKFFISK